MGGNNIKKKISDHHHLTMVISDLSSGGAQRVLSMLANSWAANGKKICVVTLSGLESDFFNLDPQITRIPLSITNRTHNLFQKIFRNIDRIIILRKALRNSYSPIVVSFIGTTNILTILASLWLRKRVVICERNDPAAQSLGFFWNPLRRFIYPHADVITVNSYKNLTKLEKYISHNKLRYIPNPLIVKTHPTNLMNDQKIILCVGRLTYQKAYDILLRAFSIVVKNIPEWNLVVIGKGELEVELKNLADDLGISNNISWIGEVNDPYQYYQKASIFSLASRYEGTSNAMLEAMSIGIPVIVSSTSSGCLEYVENEITGLVFPNEDYESLAQSILRLIQDFSLSRRLGEAGREKVKENEISKVINKWEQVLGLVNH